MGGGEKVSVTFTSRRLVWRPWGGWIRTTECRLQRPMPYHLATPHQRLAGSSTKPRRTLFLLLGDRADLRVHRPQIVGRRQDQLRTAHAGGEGDYIEKLDRFIGEHRIR